MQTQDWTVADAEWAMANWEWGLSAALVQAVDACRWDDAVPLKNSLDVVRTKRRALAEGHSTPQSAYALGQLIVRGMANRGIKTIPSTEGEDGVRDAEQRLGARGCRHGDQPEGFERGGRCFWCDAPLTSRFEPYYGSCPVEPVPTVTLAKDRRQLVKGA